MALGIRRAAPAFMITLLAGASLAATPAARAAPSHVSGSAMATASATCRSVTRGVPSRSNTPPPHLKLAAANSVLCVWIKAGFYDASGLGWPLAAYLCTEDGHHYVDYNPDVVSQYLCQETSTGYQLWLLICISTRTPPLAETWINTHSQKAMEVYHSSTDNNATVDQWPYNGTNTQWWVRALGPSGYDLVINVNSGKCLDVLGASTASQAAVVQYDCTGNPDQQWAWRGTGSTYNGWPVYNIVNHHSGLCVDVPHSSTTQGQALWQYGCNQTGAQAWY
jgi:Ricin-type beta-trefoil lectin domain-like